ncbi:MAG: uL22 family ribosomal protein [Candidatus Shikimatogenerans bostrichidophilus]|nr:MAG: uL22 family ribosomal protein [Candidatus Shikimatogenerans bostrichidophilus]
MGKRKKNKSIEIKEKKKKKYYSIIKNLKISPRKIRPLINILKGKNVFNAIEILKNYISNKQSKILINLILSTISNFRIKKKKNENEKFLYIHNIIVNSSGIIKRTIFAPQGRLNKIRKRLSLIKLEIKIKK